MLRHDQRAFVELKLGTLGKIFSRLQIEIFSYFSEQLETFESNVRTCFLEKKEKKIYRQFVSAKLVQRVIRVKIPVSRPDCSVTLAF